MDQVTPENSVAWRAVRYGTPVASSEGETIGTVREVLGSDSEDIFHGLRVGLTAGHRDVQVPADSVVRLGADRVDTSLAKAAIEALPAFTEEATYHLASVGWLRKHLGWRQDSKSDEEAG